MPRLWWLVSTRWGGGYETLLHGGNWDVYRTGERHRAQKLPGVVRMDRRVPEPDSYFLGLLQHMPTPFYFSSLWCFPGQHELQREGGLAQSQQQNIQEVPEQRRRAQALETGTRSESHLCLSMAGGNPKGFCISVPQFPPMKGEPNSQPVSKGHLKLLNNWKPLVWLRSRLRTWAWWHSVCLASMGTRV